MSVRDVDVSSAPAQALLDAASREFALVATRDGRVRWADARAERLAGLRAGGTLADAAAPGSGQKLAALLAAPVGETVAARAAVLLRDGTPVTASLRATAADADGTALLLTGNVVGNDYGALLAQMSEQLSEIATLHRRAERLHREVVESTQGMSALYAELEDTNVALKVASESRARFTAQMGHELKTPLSSILALSKLLLGRLDGELTLEQERQVGFIRRSADELLDLVHDLLELSKLDAQRLPLRPSEFDVETLFGTLRGQLRPIAVRDTVRLEFDAPIGAATLRTDEGKVAQVLRNLVSNALKFTERGEVRVAAHAREDGQVAFTVRDTGIGIAESHLALVFEEFAQIEHPLQREAGGTGLGLSVSARLASILGGRLDVESTLGVGSTFTLTIPAVHPDVIEFAEMTARGQEVPPGRAPVLVVEDDHQSLFLYERYLADSGFHVVPARGLADARRLLTTMRPAAIVLDVMLDGETSWPFLSELKRDPATADIPTLVVTVMDGERRARALGADEFLVKPVEREWLLRRLRALCAPAQDAPTVLVVDDDDVARYVVRRLLAETEYRVIEAADGPDGLRIAREAAPDVILLDVVMPTMTAFEVLDELKGDARTRSIPVIVSTAKTLDAEERQRLASQTVAVLAKDRLSREVAIGRIRDALLQTLGAAPGGAAPRGAAVGAHGAGHPAAHGAPEGVDA